jgi:hypothetical protein
MKQAKLKRKMIKSIMLDYHRSKLGNRLGYVGKKKSLLIKDCYFDHM